MKLERSQELALVRALDSGFVDGEFRPLAQDLGFAVGRSHVDRGRLTPAGRLLAQAIRDRDLATARGLELSAAHWSTHAYEWDALRCRNPDAPDRAPILRRKANLLRHWAQAIREGRL